MSDFLERENELLGGEFSSSLPSATGGGDEIDFDRAASAFPDLDNIGADAPIPSAPAAHTTNSNGGFGDFDFIPKEPVVHNVKVTADDEIEKFEDAFPDIQPTPQPLPIVSPMAPAATGTPFAPKPQHSSFSSTPILQSGFTAEDEPEVIRQWREKQAEEIKARDDASSARRQETITKAEKAIDQFYEEYNQKKERNIKENKQDEIEFLNHQTESLSAGTTWTRICGLLELENSQSKTIARAGPNTTDLSRFKDVLLRLKREGDAAPGAAGY